MPTHGDDLIRWSFAHGSRFIDGLGDNFDPNYYANQSRDDGFAYGDLLRLDGGALSVIMTGWDSGYAYDRSANTATRVTFSGIEQVYGGNGNDVFRAGGITQALDGWRGVSFFGGGGNDNIVTSRFDDFVDPGDGNDIVSCGYGSDHVDASRGNDTINGGPGGDNIRWGGGDASWLSPGDDVLTGGEGYDLVNLWAHYGSADGTPGTTVDIDVIRADGAMTGTGTVRINAAGDTDTASFRGFELGWTHQGNDTIDASGAQVLGDRGILWGARWGDDRLTGSSGDDTLEGGPGADMLRGGAGDDLIVCADSFYDLGAPGDGEMDTIIFRAGDGHDTVTGFDAGLDTLDLGGASYSARETANGTLLTLDSANTILIYGVFDIL
ncbi:calcium-binding protein [Paracoccus lutimaris]|uniref:Hemolysin type calcium-binding protein n=1 Tax=Paracoccus lutimaris TaxID=1490030 RepID=A0A368YXX9_9RHOB|nr:calcium-binding protein [Paracoccus lutimaris]RCW84106.1 hemolysin type calcium-binding protein [Paracoccus lutimaris]